MSEKSYSGFDRYLKEGKRDSVKQRKKINDVFLSGSKKQTSLSKLRGYSNMSDYIE